MLRSIDVLVGGRFPSWHMSSQVWRNVQAFDRQQVYIIPLWIHQIMYFHTALVLAADVPFSVPVSSVTKSLMESLHKTRSERKFRVLLTNKEGNNTSVGFGLEPCFVVNFLCRPSVTTHVCVSSHESLSHVYTLMQKYS